MAEELENPANSNGSAYQEFPDDGDDSCCSTPFVSAPSSPGRGTLHGGFYYSAPASPMHFVLSSSNLSSYPSAASVGDATSSFEFDFSTTLPATGPSSPVSMTSADELFFNGQIRPMKLSAHLQRPQILAPLIESDDAAEADPPVFARGRDIKLRAGSLRRRTRSMSPMRNTAPTSFLWNDDDDGDADEKKKQNANSSAQNDNEGAEEEKGSDETTPCASRSSSAGRSSKRWVFLKEFLYRSKSEGRNEGHKFWGALSFSPAKDKKLPNPKPVKDKSVKQTEVRKRAVNLNGGGGKRRGVASPLPSPHELHYTANRAQAEEMRKRTFLPYRQGLLGCLGFSSKSYGAMNGFARALNPVSSR